MTIAAPTTKEETEARLQRLLLEIDDLPSIPETLMEILKVLDDPRSGPSDLGRVVRLDAPLMARILRLANSPYYSRRGDITDIGRCVTVLGYRTVRQVAICVSVASSVMAAVANSGGKMDYRELWRHSVVTAAVSKHLAKMSGHEDPEELFTAGLLHDMGKFILELHAPEMYWRLIGERSAGGKTLLEREKEAFGFDHAELGEAFGTSWRFPAVLTSCSRYHHGFAPRDSNPAIRAATALVALADYLANTVEPPTSDLGFDPEMVSVEELHVAAGLTVGQVESHLAAIREDITQVSAFLDLS
ncbi:HDOD domain-containing protein [bacterium]|nr:HDOD domain-containing protein [bacterium]PIV81872.1 MAG: hypothetical protein COW53_02015 [bacterium CG17_big_fil_post_rev_8_21_14_2_50_64_8]PJA75293.1 MAG: hypothetical protein CO151_06695 [bacterium CG_4_9_14_3_um_filter_65_15]